MSPPLAFVTPELELKMQVFMQYHNSYRLQPWMEPVVAPMAAAGGDGDGDEPDGDDEPASDDEDEDDEDDMDEECDSSSDSEDDTAASALLHLTASDNEWLGDGASTEADDSTDSTYVPGDESSTHSALVTMEAEVTSVETIDLTMDSDDDEE
jgi:hypothetical protein